ncbi:MAG: L,D-transpeptidase family protein [Bdellovibrionales bacterium]|nr:L,D-transpeptidase family protein [Bdellovibrionales bacterium]
MKYFISAFIVLSFSTLISHASDEPVVVVDKSKFQIHMAEYKNDSLVIFKTYPITLGKNSGDKILEGDQKTPEGIYRFTAKYGPPQIQKKLGDMAFYVDYPNSIDRRDKKTGYAIMLHATDDPSRLERNQDSDGCLVTSNEKIKEMSEYIHPPYSMILIYNELKPEFLVADSKVDLKNAFNKWLTAWTTKDIDTYIDSYAEDFRFEAMNRSQYKDYKSILNKKYDVIDVKATDVRFYTHPKYDVVTFTQTYSATFKNGKVAFLSRGQKRLYFIKEEGKLKIYSEDFSRMSL